MEIHRLRVKVGLFLLFVGMGWGCSSTDKNPKANYTIPSSIPGWQTSKSAPFDFIFRDQASSAKSLFVRSQCNRQEALTLAQMRRTMLLGIQRPTINSEETFVLQDREALRSNVSGYMDGVPVNLTVVNYQKNFCQFEFVSWEAQDLLDLVLKEFRFP